MTTPRFTVLATSLVLAGLWLATAAPSRAGGKKGHKAAVTEGMDCSACHTTDGWGLAAGAGGGFDHARTGFPLTGRHARTACAGCHQPNREIGRDCAGCHADAHRGRLGADCAECHNSRDFTDTRAIARHRRTRLPLTGVHAVLDCTSCHIRRTEGSWSHVPADCFSCHEADYRRTDVHPPHAGDPLDPSVKPLSRQCQTCHRAVAWSPAFVRAGTFASRVSAVTVPEGHDLRFRISSGSHRGAACDSCHASAKLPRLVRCTGCHAHSGVGLRALHRGARVATDGPACLRCHPGGARR